MRLRLCHGLLAGALAALVAGCAPPRQMASYVVIDPDGMTERMAMLCYWGLHDCRDDVPAPDWSDVSPARRDQGPPRGQVSDNTPDVRHSPAR